jgi:cystathionine beta-lyase
MSNYNHIESALIHGGIAGDEKTGAVSVPIYQTSTFKYEAFGRHRGYEYSRTANPTREALEALIAELERGQAGFAFASGMAAIAAALSLFRSGDMVIISNNVYGGTFRLLDTVFRNFGIGYRIEDTTDLDALDASMTPDVKAILVESPANPLLTVTDLKGVGALAKKHGILSIVDNTFMTPYLQRPIEFGINMVIHSATKYLGGHNDLIGGLIVTDSQALAEEVRFIQNNTGGILQPLDAFLLIRSIKSLAVRMDRHVENTRAAADFLKRHEAVKRLYYPGLRDCQGYEVNSRQAKNGGAMLSFELQEGYDIKAFFEGLHLIILAESLGGAESLICHPATMTHAAIPEDIRQGMGITDALIRLSVGIEHITDILQDLERAFEAGKVRG